MDTQKDEIKTVKVDNNLIDHFFMQYITPENRAEIMQRLEEKRSIVAGFFLKEKLLFVTVLDFEHDTLHVREVGGYFARTYEVLDHFTKGFAKYCNLTYVTFNTNHRAIEKFANRAGFENNGDEFVKVIH